MVKKILGWLRAEWAALAAIGAAFFTAISQFVISPPAGIYTSLDEALTKFGAFWVTVTVGIVGAWAGKFNRPENFKYWASACVILSIVGLGLFLEYRDLTTSYTVIYNDSPVVVGSQAEYTDLARTYKQEHPDYTDRDLMYDFAGDYNALWVPKSVDNRRQILAILYICLFPVFSALMVSLLQSIRCVYQQKPHKPA
jgi:hypothetical protein